MGGLPRSGGLLLWPGYLLSPTAPGPSTTDVTVGVGRTPTVALSATPAGAWIVDDSLARGFRVHPVGASHALLTLPYLNFLSSLSQLSPFTPQYFRIGWWIITASESSGREPIIMSLSYRCQLVAARSFLGKE